MRLYAESSAVLAWLLGESRAAEIGAELGGAEEIVASTLTLAECERALVRALASGSLRETDAVERRALLRRAAVHWSILGLDDEVVERAGRPFPVEPIRTLDGLHLASALVARAELPDLEVLSLDGRVRESAGALGFPVRPREPISPRSGTRVEKA